MGGAGVGLAQGAVGAYWNPAGIPQAENTSGLQIPVGVNATISGPLVQGVNDFNQLTKDCKAGDTVNCTQPNIDAALSKIGAPNSGLRANVGAGLNLKIKHIVVFVNDFTYLGGVARPDAINISTTAVGSGTNNSKVILRGLSVVEIGVGYGRELSFAPGVMVGGNLKALVGVAGYAQNAIFNNDDSTFGKFDKNNNTKQSIQPGVDLGILWDINRTWEGAPMRPRLGITAHNINGPRFKQPDAATLAGEPDKFPLNGNVRAGLALSPFHFWNIVADADLTKNLTPLGGVASRNIALGTEINVFNRTWINIPLRAGLWRNTADKGSKTGLSLGAGLNFLHLTLDAAGTFTPSNQVIQSQGKNEKIPSSVGVAVQLGLQFGGGKQAKKPAEAAPANAELPGSDADRVKKNADESFKELEKTEAAAPGQ